MNSLPSASGMVVVSRFPKEFTATDRISFLRHFGAVRVFPIRNRADRLCAEFKDVRLAIQSLHQLKVLDRRLVAVYGSDNMMSGDSEPLLEPTSTGIENLNKFFRAIGGTASIFEQPPNPALKYVYPEPTSPILLQILRALKQSPSFYQQTMHLMNRINFPPPFRSEDIPVAALDAIPLPQPIIAMPAIDNRKRKATQILINLKTVNLATSACNEVPETVEPFTVNKEEVADSQQRLTEEEMRAHPLFASCNIAPVSNKLYIKNLAASVTEEQLDAMFRPFLSRPDETLHVRLMTTGRMRGQAFITFDNNSGSEQARNSTNGIILEGKPIVVNYGKASGQAERDTAPTST